MALVGHCISDVIDAQTVSLGCIFRFVGRIVGMFPGIAIVLIETHSDHDAPVVVINATPVGVGSVLLIYASAI